MLPALFISYNLIMSRKLVIGECDVCGAYSAFTVWSRCSHSWRAASRQHVLNGHFSWPRHTMAPMCLVINMSSVSGLRGEKKHQLHIVKMAMWGVAAPMLELCWPPPPHSLSRAVCFDCVHLIMTRAEVSINTRRKYGGHYPDNVRRHRLHVGTRGLL